MRTPAAGGRAGLRAGGRHPQGFRHVLLPAKSPNTHEIWPCNCLKLGFLLSKSKRFCPVLIKLGEYVGGHNILTKFYNQPNPPGASALWPLNCLKLWFTPSKSISFHPVFIKRGEYVGGHIISTKFYNQPNSPQALLNYGH